MIPTVATMTSLASKRNIASTATIWPVWKNSLRAEVVFCPKSKATISKLWHRARQWDQRTRQKHKHGGIIGRSALAVWYALLHDFLNARTGRLDPSVTAISAKSGVSPRTVHTALNRLRSLGLLDWVRRCEKSRDEAGNFILRQRSNAYHPKMPADWLGSHDPDPPPPDPDSLGFPRRQHDPLSTAIADLEAGNPTSAYQALMVDHTDPLARALAQLGRTMGAI
jgi:hypothetical protein